VPALVSRRCNRSSSTITRAAVPANVDLEQQPVLETMAILDSEQQRPAPWWQALAAAASRTLAVVGVAVAMVSARSEGV
jgi:hypothetical protein